MHSRLYRCDGIVCAVYLNNRIFTIQWHAIINATQLQHLLVKLAIIDTLPPAVSIPFIRSPLAFSTDDLT